MWFKKAFFVLQIVGLNRLCFADGFRFDFGGFD